MADEEENIVITPADVKSWENEVASIERRITQLTKRSDLFRKKIDSARILLATLPTPTQGGEG
jgi:hypothetical protein